MLLIHKIPFSIFYEESINDAIVTDTAIDIPVMLQTYPDWGFSTLNWGFPCFFVNCKASARV